MSPDIKRWSVAVAAAIMNAIHTGAFIFTPTSIMPTIVSDFNIPLSLSTLPIAIGKIVYVLLLVPGGMLVDYVGPRRMVLLGTITAAIILMMYVTFVSSFSTLILFHVILAICSSVCGVPIYSIFIAQWFTPANIGVAMGLVLAGYSAAGTLFPLFLSALSDAYGWRDAMASVVLLLTLVGLPVTYFFLHEKPEPEIAIYRPIESSDSIEFTGISHHSPGTFIGFAGSYLLLQYCNGCFFENILFFLTVDRHFSLSAASLFFSILNISAFSAKIIGGSFGNHFDRFYVGSASSMIACVGVGFLFVGGLGFDKNNIPLLTESTTSLLLFSILYGVGYGATFNCLYSLVPTVFGRKNLGRTQSALFGIGLAGNAFSAVFTSFLRERFNSYQIPFLISLVTCIANVFVLFATRWSLGGSLDALKIRASGT